MYTPDRLFSLRKYCLIILISFTMLLFGSHIAVFSEQHEADTVDRERADIIFDWAEQTFPDFFAPPSATQFASGYYYRYYASIASFLGTYHGDVYFLHPDLILEHVGSVEYWLAQALPPEDLFTVNGVSFAMIYIPPGEYLRGSPEHEAVWEGDETQHQVQITEGFWMGETEVTQGLWKAVMGNNPSSFTDCGDNCPVEQVSWNDSQEFIQRLNELVPGGGFRLPTEAEWEYAARAGTTTPFFTGNCLDTSQANYDGRVPWSGCPAGEWRQTTIDVGILVPNAWGLYDMHGNVWEWVQDWYGDYPLGPVSDPMGPSSGTHRIVRGGAWSEPAMNCRSAMRLNFAPDFRYWDVGLRLARTR